jgi:hypothetical protein
MYPNETILPCPEVIDADDVAGIFNNRLLRAELL